MRYVCPKCLSICQHGINKSIFVELRCFKCGHNWYDTQENHKPITVAKSDLQIVE